MYPFGRLFAYWVVLTLCSGCLTHRRDRPLSEAEKCDIQPEYAWIDGKCESKTSLTYRRFTCDQKGDGSKFVGEECLPLEAVLSEKKKCEARGLDFRWGVDPQSGLFTCISPEYAQQAVDACNEISGATWDSEESLCVTPEGKQCRQRGWWWTAQWECLPPEARTCSASTDGSVWLNGRCLSREDQACLTKGAFYVYSREKQSCVRKNFNQFCEDARKTQETGLQKTMEALLEIAGTRNCSGTAERLNLGGSLDISGRGLTDISVVASLREIRTLNASSNEIRDLAPLAAMPQLQTLDLSDNRLTELSGLKELPKLRTLTLSNNLLRGVEHVAQLPALERLYLDRNQLTSLEAFEHRKKGANPLKVLNINKNCTLQTTRGLDRLPKLTLLFARQVGFTKNSLPKSVLANSALQAEVQTCKTGAP